MSENSAESVKPCYADGDSWSAYRKETMFKAFLLGLETALSVFKGALLVVQIKSSARIDHLDLCCLRSMEVGTVTFLGRTNGTKPSTKSTVC